VFTLLSTTGKRLAVFSLYPVNASTIGYAFDTWNPYQGVDSVTTGTFNRAQWYSIQIRWKRDTSSGGAEVWIDGASKGRNFTLNTGSEEAGQIRFGSAGEWNWPSSGFVDFDDVAVEGQAATTSSDLASDVFRVSSLQRPNIVLRNGVTLRRVASPTALRDLTWSWANGFLYIRDAAGDPSSAGNVIETSVRNAGVVIDGKTYVTIRELDIGHADQAGILVQGNTNSCEILDNEVHHNASNGYKAGVILVGAQNCQIRRNLIHNNDGDGIALSGYNGANTSFNTVSENIVHSNDLVWDDAGGINLWLAGRGNFLADNRSYQNGTPSTRSSGIMIDELSGATVAIRNVCWGNSNGGILLAGNGHTIVNNTLYRNSQGFYDAGELNLFTTSIDKTSGSIIRNNIAVAAPGKEVVHTSEGATYGHLFSNNLYVGDVWNWNGTRTTHAQWQTSARDYSRVADPQFIEPAASNFRLRPTSPAIDAGVVVPNVGQTQVGASPDIGAIEYVP
jgi:hypothetical protein